MNYLFTSDIFKGSRYEKGHPLDMDRVWPSVELIQLMGWVNEEQIIKKQEEKRTYWIDKVHKLLIRILLGLIGLWALARFIVYVE